MMNNRQFVLGIMFAAILAATGVVASPGVAYAACGDMMRPTPCPKKKKSPTPPPPPRHTKTPTASLTFTPTASMTFTPTATQGASQPAATATTVQAGGPGPGDGSAQGKGNPLPPPWLWLGAFGGVLALGLLVLALGGKPPDITAMFNPKEYDINKSFPSKHHDEESSPLEYDDHPPSASPRDGDDG